MTKTLPIHEVKPRAFGSFSCGISELDDYLRRFAKTNHKKGIGKTFVLLENEIVIGFYTLSMASVEFQNIPEKFHQGIPKYPTPVARIGRLAIEKNSQGRNLGRVLLVDAFERILHASLTVASYGIIVDAKNESAKRFYQHFGFIPFQNSAMSLFLPMTTVEILIN